MGACIVRQESISAKGCVQWYAEVGVVKEHVRKVLFDISASTTDFNSLTLCGHGKNESLEGEEFFFNYRMRLLGCRYLLAMDY
jgi:hypothetical protein